ncbi:transcription factor MYB98-like [Magnolia sinica]|uniref:transcription factor MYB98-like n=1 Tax=Magnolia sinica TaxID=86752 RepID=UPI002658025B|nr:transcription factor MYB98-like [Magnolia sinica]
MDFGPACLSGTCPIPDREDGFSLESCYSEGSQDFYNLDPLVSDSKLGMPASTIYPFGAPTNGCMSNFDIELPKIFAEDHRNGPAEKFQTRGLMDYPPIAVADQMEQNPNYALDFQYMDPINFVVPDEISCVTGDNGIYGEVGVDRKSMQMRSNGRNQYKRHVIKGQWSLEEDRLLIFLVEKFGLKKWADIAKILKGRIGKQCRERWQNHLRPNIKKENWTEEEDVILIEAHQVIGNKWAEIAKRLPRRTENSIKNHWNATKRRQFAHRRSRSSRYSKPSMLLQSYIETVIASKPSDAATSKENPQPQNNDLCHDDRVVPNNDLDDIVNLPIRPDSLMDRCGGIGGPLFDDMSTTGIMPCGADVGGDSCMGIEVALDVGYNSLMQCENGKREMDLVEMISQTNNKIKMRES